MILEADPLRSKLRVTSENLILVPIDGPLVMAYLDGPDKFAAALNANLPQDWDISEHFSGGLRQADALDSQPELYGKSAWWAMRMGDRQLVGLFQFYFDPTDPSTPYIGYEIAPGERGKGYATEGLRALVAWIFNDDQVTRLCAECDHDNPASLRVMQKAGLKHLPVNGNAVIRCEVLNPNADPAAPRSYPNILLDLCPFRYHSQENQARVLRWTYHNRKRSLLILAVSLAAIVYTRPDRIGLVAVAALVAALYLCYEWFHNLTKSPVYAPHLAAVHRPQLRDNGLYWSSSASSGHIYPWSMIPFAEDRGEEIWLLLKGRHPVKLPREAFEIEGLKESALQILRNAGVQIKGEA